MRKYPVQVPEEERRKWTKRFRQLAVFEWFSLIGFAAMGYVLSLMLWDSHFAAVGGAVAVVGFLLLASFSLPSWRRVHVETWRLLRQGLPLDTMK